MLLAMAWQVPAADTTATPACTIGPARLVELPLIPVAINERGDILGVDASHRAALLRAGGKLEELPLPAGFEHSEAVSINGDGTAVAVATDAAGMHRLPYVVASGRLTLLGGGAARPFRIDDAGAVAGEAVLPGGVRSEPVLWHASAPGSSQQPRDGAAASALPELEPHAIHTCCGGTAKVLDGHGLVAGDAYDEAGHYHAFRWTEGAVLERLGAPDRFSSSLAMNRRGHLLIIEFPRILLAGPQGLEPLTLAPKGRAYPHALNDCDVVVGEVGPFSDAARAFAWDRAQGFMDLNALLPPSSSLTLHAALDINNRGEIVGRGEAARDIVKGFLLEPDRR